MYTNGSRRTLNALFAGGCRVYAAAHTSQECVHHNSECLVAGRPAALIIDTGEHAARFGVQQLRKANALLGSFCWCLCV